MGLLAREADGVTLDTESAEHHPERKVHPLQDGTLLDVQLQVGDGVLQLPPRLVDAVEVNAMLLERIWECDAVAVFEVAHVVGPERARGRTRAEEAAPKASPLLVGPVYETQSHGTLLRGEGAHDFEGANHVKGTVEPASVRDGVYVSAQDDGTFRVTWCRGPDVAGLVGLYLGYAFYLLQLACEPLAGLLPLLGPRVVVNDTGTTGEFGELPEFIYGAASVYLLGLHQPTFSGVAAPTSARASSMMSAASSAASRVMRSGGEMRMVFALRPPLPTSRPRARQASRKRTAATGSGARSSPASSRASIRPRPRTSATVSWSSAILRRRSLRWAPTSWALVCRSLSRMYFRFARAPAVEIGFPPKVERWRLGATDSTTSALPTTPPMARPLPRPLAITIMSGSTSKASMPQKCSPVRPKPVWTSSEIKSIPVSSRMLLTRSK